MLNHKCRAVLKNDDSWQLKLVRYKIHFLFSYFIYIGADAGWEEYWDYIFPEEEAAKPNMKLLEMAKKWKQKQTNDDETPEE